MPKARTTDTPQQRRMKDEDVDMLYDAMMKHGPNFHAIVEDIEFARLTDFTPATLQSRYSHLVTKKDARFYRLRETLISSRSGMSSPSSTPRSGTPQAKQQQQKPRETLNRFSRTPSASNVSNGVSSQSQFKRDGNDVIEVIDIEALEGRNGIVGQFNVKLSNMKRAWIPKDHFRSEDLPALRQYIRKLELKLRVAGMELKRITRNEKGNKSKDSSNDESENDGSNKDLSLSDGEDEDTLMDGIVSDEDKDRDDSKGSEDSDEQEKETRGKRRTRPIVEGKEDSESEVSEVGTVDLEGKPAPLQYSDEEDIAEPESPEESKEPEESEDSEKDDISDAEEELPSPEECLEDMFMTQAQTQVSEVNAQKSFPSKSARLNSAVKIVEPNPFLATPSLPISIDENTQEENAAPAQTITSKRPAGGADDDLARKKKRIIETIGAARSNPEVDEKCTIM